MPTEEKLKIIQDSPKKFHFKTKDDQRVNIEHKNNRIVLALYKWGEEVSLETSLSMALRNKIDFLENRIELETSAIKLVVYPIDTYSTGEHYGDSDDVICCHDGGLRFELVLKVKPPVNYFSVPLIAKNLRCAYQPFLTQEEIEQGVIRPLNTEGSYAFYHASKKNNQYMTGKVFHLFRPIVEDALGNKAWCSLYINPEITELTITIPQPFLDEATYPITIDPDFGYAIIGGSIKNIGASDGSHRRGSAWTMPAPGGTANWMKAYIGGTAGVTEDCKVFINEEDSGGAGNHGQIATEENLACAEADHWEEFTLADEALTAAVVYILNIMSSMAPKGSNYHLAYDENGVAASYYEINTYATPESPWIVDPESPKTNDYSIYCDYDEVAGEHYYRSASAGFGLVGTTDRLLSALRSSPSSIGVTGVSGRGFVGTRSTSAVFSLVGNPGRVLGALRLASASLSAVAVATRSQVFVRLASAAFSLVGTPGRTLEAFRFASAALGITGATGRILHAVRLAGATISAVGTATRSWIGSRTASASLGVSAVATGIKGFIRSASASMSVVGTAARSWVGTRPASAAIGIVGATDRLLHSLRSAPASMIQIATATRAAMLTRAASGVMAVQGTANRTVNNMRLAAAAISSSAIAGRVMNNIRSAPASVSLVAEGKRAYQGVRSAAASMNVEALGWFLRRIIKGVVTLRFAGKTRILDFADKIRKLKFGRKET